jgi:hypothetical protein
MAALVRRFVDWASLFLPLKFHVDIGGVPVCTFKQNFNPFVKKLMIDSHRRQAWAPGQAAGPRRGPS